MTNRYHSKSSEQDNVLAVIAGKAEGVVARRWLVVSIALLFAVSGGSYHYLTPRYTASGQVMVKPPEQGVLDGLVSGAAKGASDPMDHYALLLTSPETRKRLAKLIREKHPNLVKSQARPGRSEKEVALALAYGVSFHVGKNTIVIRVVTSSRTATAVLAELGTTFAKDLLNEYEETQHKNTISFLEFQTERIQKDITELSQRVLDLKRKEGVIAIETLVESIERRKQELESQKHALLLTQDSNRRIMDFYERKLTGELGHNEFRLNREVIARLSDRLSALKEKRGLLLATGHGESEAARSVNQEIIELSENLKRAGGVSPEEENELPLSRGEILKRLSELKITYQTSDIQLKTIEEYLRKLTPSIKYLPEIVQRVQVESSKLQAAQSLLSELRSAMVKANMGHIAKGQKFTILQMPSQDSVELTVSVLVGFISFLAIGIFFGVVLALLGEEMNPSVKTPSDLKYFKSNLIGVLPDFEEGILKRAYRTVRFRPKVVNTLTHSPGSALSMAMRFVRTKLMIAAERNKPPAKIISILSGHENEGKSFVCANLVISLAGLRKKVLLIDADLRRGGTSSYFLAEHRDGLSEILVEQRDDIQPLKLNLAGEGEVFFLPRGEFSESASELILGGKFQEVLKKLAPKFDLVVIDTPPIGVVADAISIAELCDIQLYVARAYRTRIETISELLNRLSLVSNSPVLFVLNRVRKGVGMGGNYYSVIRSERKVGVA